MTAEEFTVGAEIIVPAGEDCGNARPYRLRIDDVIAIWKSGYVEVGGTLLRMNGAPSTSRRPYRVVALIPSGVRLATDADGRA